MTPFRIKRLYMENYKLFYRRELEFGEILTILDGPNGYGKTSVFDALEFLIMGTIRRVVDSQVVSGNLAFTANFLAGNPQKDVYIKGEFVSESQHLIFAKRIAPVVKNSRSNNPKQLETQAKTYHLPDYNCPVEEWDQYLVEPSFIQSLLGIENVQSFHLAHYIQQEDRLSYFNSSEEDRTKLIQQLFGMEEAEQFFNRISAAQKQVKVMLKKLDIDIVQLTQSLEHTDEMQAEQIVYQRLFPNEEFLWDSRKPPFKGKATEGQYKEMREQVANLLEFVQRKDQFLFFWPIEAFSTLNSEIQRSHILAYAYMTHFGAEALEECTQAQHMLRFLSEQMKYAETQKYFDIAYRELTKLLDKSAVLGNFETLCSRAKTIQKNQSDLQRASSHIMELRTQLHDSINSIGSTSAICPYCGNNWEKPETLDLHFQETSRFLSDVFGRESTELNDIYQEIQVLFETELKVPLEQRYRELSQDLALQIFMTYSSSNDLKGQAQTVEQLLRTSGMQKLYFEWANTLSECFIEADQRVSIILSRISQVPSDYAEAVTTYHFSEIFKTYFHERAEFINITPEQVKQKLLYIQQMYYSSFDADREKLQILQKNQTDLLTLHQQLQEYELAYKGALIAYRETIISQIEIPFFLYSSRILQSYQGGQGVLIQSDGKTIRFTTPGGEHDVLYTMSSGQLSAVLMAFSLAIHRIYTSNQFKTLLIDDPIQCMDDINMVSLIELLRSDFCEVQIILSTHEEQFANYIAYKYGKYNLPRKSISLKDLHADEMQ